MTVVSSLQVRPADRSLSAGKSALRLAGRGIARARTCSAAAAQEGEERHILGHRPGDGLTVFRFDQPASGIGHMKAIVRTKKAQRATLKATGKPVDHHPRARSQVSHVTLRQREHLLEDIKKARPTANTTQGEKRRPRRQEGFAMTNRFIVAIMAFLLFLFQFNGARSAGLYDGEWQGTATSVGERCKRANVNLTVEGHVVLGQAKFDGDTSSISGSVTERGAVGATIGFQFLKGQFNGDEFEGTFKFSDCQWEAVLKRTGTGDRNRAASSGMKGR